MLGGIPDVNAFKWAKQIGKLQGAVNGIEETQTDIVRQKPEFSRHARIDEQVGTCNQTTYEEWEPHDGSCMQTFLFEDHGRYGDSASWACLGASWQTSF